MWMVSLAPSTLPDDFVPAMVTAAAAASERFRKERRVSDMQVPLETGPCEASRACGSFAGCSALEGMTLYSVLTHPTGQAKSEQEQARLLTLRNRRCPR